MKKCLFLFLIVPFLTGCSHRIMDFTIVSTKNVELSKFSTYQRGKTRVEGIDKKPIIIIIPTGYPSGEEAIDNAIESVPGAVALLDGVLTYSYFYIPYIYGEYVFAVEGTPLIDPALAAKSSLDAVEGYSVCLLDENGSVERVVKYTPEDYEALKTNLFHNPIRQVKKIDKI